MHHWFKIERLTYSLETLDSYERHLAAAGYEDVSIADATDWYRDGGRNRQRRDAAGLLPRSSP